MDFETLAIWAVALIVGALGSPTLIQYIKLKLGLEGRAALALTAAISVVLAVVLKFASGAIGVADITWANVPDLFTAIFAGAYFIYRLFLKDEY